MDLFHVSDSAKIIASIDAIEILDAVPASLPSQAVQVHGVRNAEVLETDTGRRRLIASGNLISGHFVRPSNHCKTSSWSDRSGVAVSPRRIFGPDMVEQLTIAGAAACGIHRRPRNRTRQAAVATIRERELKLWMDR